MKRKHSLNQEFDKKLFDAVNESIDFRSMMLLQEAEDETEDEGLLDDVSLQNRMLQLQAFADMQKNIRAAGFEKTADSLEKGKTLLKNNVTFDNKEANSLFFTAVIMMRSMQTLLTSILVQVDALKEAKKINSLNVLYEQLSTKKLGSFLFEKNDNDNDEDRPTEPDVRTVANDDDETEATDDTVASGGTEASSMSGPATRVTGPGSDSTSPENAPTRADNSSEPTAIRGSNDSQEDTRVDARTNPSRASTDNSAAGANPSAERDGPPTSSSSPIIAVKGEDGAYSKEETEKQVQKLVNTAFKPSPGFMKWLGKTKAGNLISNIKKSYKEVESRGAARESFENNKQDLLNEGFGDWVKGLFTGSSPTAKSTVQSMLPLTGGIPIHKSLFSDLMSGVNSDNRAERIRAINLASTSIATKMKGFAGTAPPAPPTPPAAPAAAAPQGGQEDRAQAQARGEGDGSQSREGRAGESSQNAGNSRSEERKKEKSGGEKPKKKRLTRKLGINPDQAKSIMTALKNAEINVKTPPSVNLNDDQKSELSALLQNAERKMRKNLKDTFRESKEESDSLIMERWLHLAGINK